MAKEWIKVSVGRYLTTDEGIEITPVVSADVALIDGDEVEKHLPRLMKSLMDIELPPSDVLGGELRPMTDEEVADFRENRND